MKTHTYILEHLGCANCAAKMERKIRALPQVTEATITFATRQLSLTAPDPEALLPQIRAIVSSIEPQVRVTVPHEEHHHDHSPKEGILIGVGATLFAVGLLTDGFGPLSKALFVLSWLVLGLPVLKQAATGLLRGQLLDENFLMSIATVGAFCIDQFPEAVGIMLFYRVGEAFEHRAVERSRKQIRDALDLRPETVLLADGRQIPAEAAQPGDILQIRPGDRIGLDCVVLTGESRIDTAPITGEPVPVRVMPGDNVTSGCINGSGHLTVRVEKPLSQSLVTRILHSVEEAAASKPKLDRFITRFARIYTPVVVIAALITAIIPSLITGHWSYWIRTALSFLVMSCPCALVLSVPLAFFSGIGVAGRQGILFKSGSVIEALSQTKAVVMDKTGTLTEGTFEVRQVVGDQRTLTLCAACEQGSTHPIAVSIVAAAGDAPLPRPTALEEIPGQGIRATLEGHRILCGNRKLMEAHGIPLPEDAQAQVYVAEDGKYLGHLLIGDRLKPNATEAVSRLHTMGLETAILTGDDETHARTVAQNAGVHRVHAGLLPHEKLDILQRLRQDLGPCLFVGDGINDAPVLSGADAGAAMGSGADAAIEAADLVYLTSDPNAIPQSLTIARRTRTIALQNVTFALAIKALVMVLGLLGHASLWLAVFADSGVAMLCVLNSIRMLYQKRP